MSGLLKKSIKFLLSGLFILCLAAPALYGGATEVWIERVDSQEKFAYIGDVLKFNVMTDTHGEKITGVAAYLTFDPEIFQIIPPVGNPFTVGNFLKTSVAVINNTHGDSLHLYNQPGWGNGIDGYQLDYYQSTGPTIGGARPYARGMGVIASFQLKVLNMPLVRMDSTEIRFDFINGDNRLSCYYLLDEPGNEIRFSRHKNFKIAVTGFSIDPPLPDTLITPGTTLEIDLDEHVSTSEVNTDIIWSMTVLQSVAGVTATLTGKDVTVTTGPTSHGILKLRITGYQPGTGFTDYQDMIIGINYLPVFKIPKPVIRFYEDDKLTLPKDIFFSDADDPIANVSVYSQSPNLHINNSPDSLTFYAEPDWSGNSSVQLFIQDTIQAQIDGDTLKSAFDVQVIPVNDAPVLDVTSIDPVLMYNRLVKVLVLNKGQHVFDVDDDSFTWQVISSNTEILTGEFEANTLRLQAVDRNYTGTLPITLIASDQAGAADTAQVTINIEAPPLSIKDLPEYLVFPDSVITIDLNSLVEYPGAIKSDLYWSFNVINLTTNQVDENVLLFYNRATQTLEISALPGHKATDELYFSVTDSISSDMEKTSLKVFDVRELSIFDLPSFLIMRGTTRTSIDLDDFVIDVVDQISDLHWEVLNSDSLANVAIDQLSHMVRIEANDTFLGTTSITFKVTNSIGNYDTGKMEVVVIEYNPYPVLTPRLPDLDLFWNQSIPQFYVDLDDYVWDFDTPDSLIVWSITQDPAFVNLVKNTDDRIVNVTTLRRTGKQKVIFTARNRNGYSSSDTINVTIIKHPRPQWKIIPDIEFSNSQIYNDLYLNTFCLDPSGLPLHYTATSNEENLSISIDQATSRVTFSSLHGFSGKASVIFTAANVDTGTTSNLVNISVISQSSLACFFNSIVPNRMNFIINTEAQVENVDYLFVIDSDSIDLEFALNDISATQKIWKAPYIFTRSGLYKLSVQLQYPNGLSIDDSLWITLQLGKQLSKSMTSRDNKLKILLPDNTGPDAFIALIENTGTVSWPEGAVNQLYTVKAAGFSEPLVKVAFNTNADDKYYSFYTLEDSKAIAVETSTDNTGNFYARMNSGATFFFAPSGAAAREEVIVKHKMLCYPNPFNSAVKIQYLVDEEKIGAIRIFNILAQTVFHRDMENLEAGIHEFSWHGTDQNEMALPTGVYFIQLMLDKSSHISKVTLIR